MFKHDLFRNTLITRRQFIVISLQVIVVSALLLRLVYLQIVKHAIYFFRSKKNITSSILIPAYRGLILDCHGKKIANNVHRFRLLAKNPYRKQVRQSLEKLFLTLDLPDSEREKILKCCHKNQITIKHNLPWDEVAAIDQELLDMPGIYIDYIPVRRYPNYHLSHPLGYASFEQDKSLTGKVGIEKYYNSSLKGTPGCKTMQINALGKTIKETEFTPSSPGETLHLGIDSELQKNIAEIFGKNTGAAIVFDIESGQIRTLLSLPSFNAEEFATREISEAKWLDLQNDPTLPLLNKTIQATFPPGSTFKLVTVLAALEHGISPKERFLCHSKGVYGNNFKCWNTSGHGMLDMHQAIALSCNHYMYKIAQIIGHEPILQMARKLGLGQTVGIDLAGELSGCIPSYSKNDSSYHALNICIGQGSIKCSPLQLCRMGAIIASKGRVFDFKLSSPSATAATQIDIKESSFEVLHQAMQAAVDSKLGTARLAKNAMKIAGKTGTAQLISKSNSLNSVLPRQFQNHALFLGFGPVDKPKYVVTIIAEHGGSGGKVAAPIAGTIFNLLYKC